MNFHFKFNPPQKVKTFLTSKKVVKFIGFLFLTIGVLMAVGAVKVRIDARDALTWTPHIAEIQNANVRTHIDTDNGFKSYSVNVTYRYKWQNVFYRGEQYRLHDNASSGFDENNEIVQELLSAKKQNADNPIYVKPKNPAVSVIKNEVNSEEKVVSTAFGIILPSVGLLALFFPHWFNRGMPEQMR